MNFSLFFILKKLFFIIIAPYEKRFWYTCIVHILFSCILLIVISIQHNLLNFYENIIQAEYGHIKISLPIDQKSEYKNIVSYLELNTNIKHYNTYKEQFTLLSNQDSFFPILLKTYNNHILFNNTSLYVSESLYEKLNLIKKNKINVMILEEFNHKKNKIQFDSVSLKPLFYKDSLDPSIVYIPEKMYDAFWENDGYVIINVITNANIFETTKINSICNQLKQRFNNVYIESWNEEQPLLKKLIDIQYSIYFFLVLFFEILYLLILYCIFKLFINKWSFIKSYCLDMGIKSHIFYIFFICSAIIVLCVGIILGILLTKLIFYNLNFNNIFHFSLGQHNIFVLESII